jgi:hypothetical protein
MATRARLLVVFLVLIAMLMPAMKATAQVEWDPDFARTWERTDYPVAAGQINRTWMWGPEPFTTLGNEPYAEAPGGERLVQYFDKSRMEITNPLGDPNSIWFVTNGLLVTEMTSGWMQFGHDDFEYYGPADVNVAGDSDDPFAPTYETIGWNIEGGHTYSDGQPIGAVIDWLGYDPTLSDEWADFLIGYGVTAGPYSPETGKHTASVFWEFMNSVGLVYEGGNYYYDYLFENPYYATGLPIDQAWWAEVKVAGTYKWVLIQCFERRCLTYTPDNPPGWQVEAGNVGQHYYTWRYGDGDSGQLTEEAYIELVWDVDDQFWETDMMLDDLLEDPRIDDPSWISEVVVLLDYWQVIAEYVFDIVPPATYDLLHDDLVLAYEYIWDAADMARTGFLTKDIGLIQTAWEYYHIAQDILDEFYDALPY